jgi:hypothetical protein
VVANSAFLAAMVLLLLMFELMEQLSFLAPHRRLIFARYLWVLVAAAATVFVNLFALFYTLSRRLFLEDTGRKLAHVDQQLLTPDAIVRDLSEHLSHED